MTQQKNEADAKAKEDEKKRREVIEEERQKIRDSHVREWDVNKYSAKRIKRFRVMSQKEYVDEQRSMRIKEFAPKATVTSAPSGFSFDTQGRKTEATESPSTYSDYVETKGLYFSTAKPKPALKNLYTNFVKAQEPTPIINAIVPNKEEVNDENSEQGPIF